MVGFHKNVITTSWIFIPCHSFVRDYSCIVANFMPNLLLNIKNLALELCKYYIWGLKYIVLQLETSPEMTKIQSLLLLFLFEHYSNSRPNLGIQESIYIKKYSLNKIIIFISTYNSPFCRAIQNETSRPGLHFLSRKSVHHQILSPPAAGRFHRLIGWSYSILMRWCDAE